MATLACYLEDGSVVNHPLDKEIVTIGRSPDSLIQLQCESVSSHHGMIKHGADGFLVQDLGSSNGTKVNGAPIEEAQLNDGDRVSFGGIQTVFYAGEAPAEPDPVIAAGSAATIPVPAPNLAVADTPAPNPVVAPKPKVPLKSRTPLKKKPLPHQKSSYEESEGGCMTAFMVTVLLILAFITGLALRHHNETDQNFFSDVIEKLTGEMPKIEIER